MTDEERKEKLLKEIYKTEQQIVDYESMTEPISPDDAIGRISRMDAVNNKAVTEFALRNTREKLDKLKYLLTRVGNPDFGICLKCKSKIPIQRILIKPESLYCVKCAN